MEKHKLLNSKRKKAAAVLCIILAAAIAGVVVMCVMNSSKKIEFTVLEDKNIPKAVLSRRTSFKWHAIDGGVAFEESMNDLRITKKWILQDNILCCRLEVVNGSSSNAKIQWYLHPEWTPGGSADSYNDYVAAPLEDGDFKLTYWSGLGERRLGKMKNDCLRIVDPQNNYEISQKHDIASFENPRLWFGIGTINVEMTLKELAVMKDSEAMAQITWHFPQ